MMSKIAQVTLLVGVCTLTAPVGAAQSAILVVDLDGRKAAVEFEG